jgi:hypothetical protein
MNHYDVLVVERFVGVHARNEDDARKMIKDIIKTGGMANDTEIYVNVWPK